MSESQRKLRTYQRIAGIVLLGGLGILLVTLLIGVAVPVMVLAPASLILLILAIVWVICILMERRNAQLNATSGRSWLPDSRDAH